MFLRLLRKFLTLGVEDGDPDPATADAGGETLDDLLDADDPAADAGGEGDDAPEPVKAPGRLEKLEAELKDEREKRIRAEGAASVARPAPAPQKDALYEQEEAQLQQLRANPATTPETVAWAEWRIKTDREARENRREAQSARSEARDISDKTTWEKMEITKPNAYKRYNERVEKIIAEQKSAGQTPPPRMALYYFLLGQDADKGAVKTKAKAPSVDRGTMPGTRSDVRPNGSKGGLTKIQKLEESLRGKRI